MRVWSSLELDSVLFSVTVHAILTPRRGQLGSAGILAQMNESTLPDECNTRVQEESAETIAPASMEATAPVDSPNNPFAPSGALRPPAVSGDGASSSRPQDACQQLVEEQVALDALIDDDGGAADAFGSSDLSRAEGVELSGAVRRILHAVGDERVLSDGDAAYAHTLLQMGVQPAGIIKELTELYTTEAAVSEALASRLLHQAHKATAELGTRFTAAENLPSGSGTSDASPRLPVVPPSCDLGAPPPYPAPPPPYESFPRSLAPPPPEQALSPPPVSAFTVQTCPAPASSSIPPGTAHPPPPSGALSVSYTHLTLPTNREV